jgi:hypothetical protein
MIIAFCGQAGSGKDTAADFLVKNHGFVKVAFADVLKRVCREIFDFSDEQLWGSSAERNKPDTRYARFALNPMTATREVHGEQVGEYRDTEKGREFVPQYLTPRHALQQLGTEYGRECYPNIWVEYALRVADKLLHKSGVLRSVHYSYTQQDGLRVTNVPVGPKPAGVVISDVRFKNEIDAIRAAGGKIIRLKRGQGLEGAAGQHRSEAEQRELPDDLFDKIIDNRGYDLGDLKVHVRRIIEDLTEEKP